MTVREFSEDMGRLSSSANQGEKMTASTTELASQAESILNNRFARLRQPTKYIATFRTRTGRHLALNRTARGDIYVWAEEYPVPMPGISIKNREVPGQPYSNEQPRSSNLNIASSRLGLGNKAFYLKCETTGALERFAQWYASV